MSNFEITKPYSLDSDTKAIKVETDKIPSEIIKTTAIKAKTDNLPANPASQTNVDLIKVETDKIPATITKVDGEIVKTTAIKSKTDNLPSDPASQSLIDAKLGLTTDYASGYTVLGYHNSLYQHVHNQSYCYPTLANGIVITGGVAAWTLGNFVEIIPANTITDAFDIHYINFEEASATDSYEFVLYSGLAGSEIEIGRVRTSRESATSGLPNVPIQIPAQMANKRISAKLASKSGGSDTVTVSVYYHIYG